MQRSHSFYFHRKLTKANCLRLLLSAQLILSSIWMPLPSVAADLDSAINSGSAAQTADAVSRVLTDATSGHAEPGDENPSGWESPANEPFNESKDASANSAPAPSAVPTSTSISTPEPSTPAPVATSPSTPPASTETATSAPATETSVAPSASEIATPTATETSAPAATETSVAPPSIFEEDSTPAAPVTSETAPASSEPKTAEAATDAEPNKQIAEKAPIVSEPTEVRADDVRANKDGIGGFVGEDGDGQVALMEHGFVEQGVRETLGEVIVIDNDEAVEVETIAYEELPTDEGKTKIRSGAQFPVVMSSQLNSKNAKKGDNLQARLKYDLKIGDRLVAEKGSIVTGHINYNLPARSVMHSLVTPKRWYKNSGVIGITFDEIINSKKEHIALNAKPARRSRIVKNKAEGRELGVNDEGQITGPWGQQLKYKAIRVGLNFALAPAGVFSFGAMPVALGVMGAVNPSFAFMKPVGTNVRHRRIKGFAWGFLSGIPGSWLIEDTVTKGQECIIKPGDEFLVELKQEFTGEARSEAAIMPGSSAKVRGQVIADPKAKKSKKK